ncbi:N-acetylglucosamine-6-phosphate deacetylase [Devosia rhizoryzae]|uniref:N-acetylglucosamine-6-phosphate deacetylase n=1 Tax=Devosia rhizoryzae TaxID=2774137 RepID=A0ABX7C2J9_9HYPH|nr:N-acetylglucosamine-6-phosphate deacetylase [Devosia rhizoryzae]QQR38464.1 N-acetylglucosamine-6-phosphate deacetylase [Devosia rhizoryzae]
MISDGLFDLQVNGYAGVDFNNPSMTPAQFDLALEAMLASGVTQCLPTIITAFPNELAARFAALDRAVRSSRLGSVMVPGYHLEGPFLNAGDGYSGCHPQAAMADPDAALVARIEEGLTRPILLVTLAPERDGAMDFIAAMRRQGKTLAMAHSAAGFAQVRAAADAGLTISTHLGNGLPHTLPKLENTLLAQLSEPRLAACLIADGHHMSPDALTAMIRLKGADKCILVTDAVLGAAAAPGVYTFAGMAVERTATGAMVQPRRTVLAGSTLRLDEAVRNAMRWTGLGAETALAMASRMPRRALAHSMRKYRIDMESGRVRWASDMTPTIERLPAL